MFIIIHRTDVFEIQEMFGKIVTSLFSSNVVDIKAKIKVTRTRVDIGDIRIDFRCGDLYKMGGVIPDYYNTDSQEASDFLKCGADKVNGKEIKDISGIVDIIKRMEEHKWK